jgi:urease accessory protein UreE
MSAEQTPILSGAIPAFEMFMTAWEELGNKHPPLQRWTKIGIHWATKYYKKMDQTRAYVVSMCKFISSCHSFCM